MHDICCRTTFEPNSLKLEKLCAELDFIRPGVCCVFTRQREAIRKSNPCTTEATLTSHRLRLLVRLRRAAELFVKNGSNYVVWMRGSLHSNSQNAVQLFLALPVQAGGVGLVRKQSFDMPRDRTVWGIPDPVNATYNNFLTSPHDGLQASPWVEEQQDSCSRQASSCHMTPRLCLERLRQSRFAGCTLEWMSCRGVH